MFVIAGVTGHVGGVAARQLLAEKQPVKVIVRDAEKGKAWSAAGAEVAIGALDDANFLAATLRGAAGFFVLLPGDLGATDFYAVQRKQSDAIASGVKQSGVSHVVLLSSVGADLAEGNGPIKGLNYLENKLRETGTKLSAIRACYFAENVGNSLGPAKGMGIFPNFMASQDYPVPMVATKDIGLLVAKTLTAPPAKSENIDLDGPALTQKQVAEKLGAAIGKPLQIVDIPPPAHAATLQQAGMSPQMSEIYAEMFSGFASGKIMPRGDRKETGTTPLDDVLRDLVG